MHRHVSALIVCHLQGAFFSTCSLRFKLMFQLICQYELTYKLKHKLYKLKKAPWRWPTVTPEICYIIIIIIIIIEFITSQLWLGNVHLSWDVVINRIRVGGLICSLKSFLQLNMCQELQIFAVVYVCVCIGVQAKSC